MSARSFDVLLGATLVGHLREDASDRFHFHVLDSYRRHDQRPVLGQAFEDDLHRVYRPTRGSQLPAFFANLVPEGALRDLIEESAGIATGDDVALLSFVGEDLPGAVVVRASEDAATARERRASEREPSSADDPGVVGEDPDTDGLRFSLAGVQPKFSVVREAEKLTLPTRGRSGAWIAKLASATYPGLPENEYTTLEWAREAGFDVPPCHLQPASNLVGIPAEHIVPGSSVLVIQRYDRTSSGRVHQEDFAQVASLPPRLKYDHVTCDDLARLAQAIVGWEAYDEVIRRLVFVVASGNNDAHLKNWSLLYPDGVAAQLAPLYDQVCTVAWSGPGRESGQARLDRTLALKLGGARRFGDIHLQTFTRLAEGAGRDAGETESLVRETVSRVARAWGQLGARMRMLDLHVAALRDHWTRVPLLRDDCKGARDSLM